MQVFFSYALSDQAFARDLSSELTKRGLSVWLDDERIAPGENWHRKIANALANSDAMVVLISPESMSSRDIRNEIDYVLGNPKYEGRLFPVEVRPAKEVPWILRRMESFTASEGGKKISQSIANALSRVA